MRVNSYRELRVWQAGIELVEEIYLLTRQFPKHEIYGLASQLQRADVSVPSNIAEGHTRVHIKEYLHHLSVSQASLAEVETQIEIARRLNYISTEQCTTLNARSSSLGKQIYALRNSLLKTSSQSCD